MRILTVRQPWAWAIIHGGKNVENRVRNIAGDYRGPVLIHAGKVEFEEEGGAFVEVQRAIWRQDEGYTPTDDQLWEVADDVDPEDPRFVYGAIIGVVDLVDVHSASVLDGCGHIRHDCPDHGTCRGHCSPWAQGPAPDGWFQHLVLENPRALGGPISYRGALGLRRTNFEIIGDWLAELTDKHNCAGGGWGEPHEDLCGYEPVTRLVAKS